MVNVGRMAGTGHGPGTPDHLSALRAGLEGAPFAALPRWHPEGEEPRTGTGRHTAELSPELVERLGRSAPTWVPPATHCSWPRTCGSCPRSPASAWSSRGSGRGTSPSRCPAPCRSGFLEDPRGGRRAFPGLRAELLRDRGAGPAGEAHGGDPLFESVLDTAEGSR
ncbi:hypothetical protein HFP72_29385 [Nocardiopsis sp. ARC36]